MKFNLSGFLKEWRILLVIVLVILSIFLIAPSSQNGVVVKSINSDSPLSGKIQIGEVITWANEKEINSPQELYEFENENFTGIFRFMHSGKLDLAYIKDGYFGISVTKKSITNLEFGLDLVGGTRVLLKPKGNVTDEVVQQAIATLETRINTFGLREAKFQPIKDVAGNSYIQIEMAGGTKEEIENLLAKQGKFEGKIERIVSLKNNTGSLTLNEKTYYVELDNDTVLINNTALKENQTINIDGIDTQLFNITDENVILMLTTFTGKDIQSVCLQEQTGICVSRITKSGNGWEFNFQVFISQEGAERFANVTNDMKIVTDPDTGTKYLDGKIYLYLDEKLITSLSISADLKGKAYTTPAITGFRLSRDEALKEQLMIKSILQSGSLPVSLEIIRSDQISPVLGGEFLRDALLALIVASLAVAGVIYFRYRKFKILIPNMLWSAFELIITLGAASLIKWTIDLSSIAGLIAAIGSGTNDQIMMIDEILIGGGEEEKKIYTLKQRLKRSFFILFGSAATVIASVLPMLFVGIGAMRGFAVVTILGVLIGIVITRPAFARVAEIILEKEEKA
jgi:preprotein translocase subunit SecD